MREDRGQRSENRRRSPMEIAREIYNARRAEANLGGYGSMIPTFDEELVQHVRHGLVVHNPRCFVMAMPSFVNGQVCWLVRAAVGNLREMVRAISNRALVLPFIAFTRGESEGERARIRVYETSRFLRLVAAKDFKLKIANFKLNGEDRLDSATANLLSSNLCYKRAQTVTFSSGNRLS